MEPLASSALTPLLRPVGSVTGDPSSFLREGRLMHGEVMQNLGGDSVLLRIGDQKVTAQTQVDLEPGSRFLFQVERSGGELVLRLVEDGVARAKLDAALVDTLRTLIGRSRPIGQVHGDVLAELGALQREGGGDAQLLRDLAAAIGERAFTPGAGGAELKELLAHSGLAYEAVLMASLMQVGADDLEAALRRLASAIRGRLLYMPPGTGSLNLQQAEAFVAALPAILKQILDKLGKQERARGMVDTRPSALAALGLAFEQELEAELKALVARQGGGEVLERALENLRAQQGVLLKGREAVLLRALLGHTGRNSMTGERGREWLGRLGGDAKGQLLAGMLATGDERVHETLGRALAALDLEQLVGSLRREFGEGEHLSFPVPDGDGFATAHLFWEHETNGEALPGGPPPERTLRLVFGVDFSRLGPIRADMIWHGGRLSARIGVARPAVADSLRRSVRDLEQLMAQGGAEVRLAIVDATRAETDVEVLARDIRFLRDHHLMDVRG